MGQAGLSLDFVSSDQPSEVVVNWRKGNADPRRVFFRSDDIALRPTGDALLCLGLSPALEVAAPLKVGSPISKEMKRQADRVAGLLCHWYVGLNAMEVAATISAAPPGTAQGRALFYSAGVDSSFSMVRAADDITHLVTLIGADIPLRDPARANRVDIGHARPWPPPLERKASSSKPMCAMYRTE